MTETPNTPAGWYPDPDQAQTQRYWDGSEWTDQRAPLAVEEKVDAYSTVIVVGYVCAVLLPFVGFIIGLTQINRSSHGVWIMLLSVAVFLAFVYSIG